MLFTTYAKRGSSLGIGWSTRPETSLVGAMPRACTQYVENSLPYARIDLWGGDPPPLILCESRSLAGVLRDIARDYLCPIAATNGQAGGFLHTEIAPLVAEPGGRRVLYLGDLDLSGGHTE